MDQCPLCFDSTLQVIVGSLFEHQDIADSLPTALLEYEEERFYNVGLHQKSRPRFEGMKYSF